MKSVVKIWFLLFVGIGYSQQVSTILESDSSSSFLQLGGTIDIASSGITNSFINRVYVDGFFNDEVKEDVTNRLHDKSNRYQDISSLGLLYATKNKKLNWSIELKDVKNSSMTFSKNVFSLLMYGNKPYTGVNLDLDNTLFVSQRYQSLGFGVNRALGKWTFGVGVNVLKGAYFDMFSLTNGEFFTAEDGTEVRAKGNLKSLNSETHRGTNFDGIGVSFNGIIRRDISESLSIELAANDIGFIDWKELSQVDGVLDKTFTPTEIDSALNFNTTDFTLTELSGLEQSKTSFRYRTAGNVSLRTKAQLSDKLFARVGALMFIQKGAVPLVYINPMYTWKGKHALGFTLQAGGFSNKDIILNYELKIKQKYNVGININALEALINPNKTSSQGLNAYFISYF